MTTEEVTHIPTEEEKLPESLTLQIFRVDESDTTLKSIVPVQYPDDILRMLSQPIMVVDADVKRLIHVMAKTMIDFGGIGLAANQIGYPYQVIVIDTSGKHDFLAFINPEIIERSDETMDSYEACLSVPVGPAKLKRSKSITVRSLTVFGQEQTMTLDGFSATVLQHEIDHLHGIIFADRVEGLKKSIIDRKLARLLRKAKKTAKTEAEAKKNVERLVQQGKKKSRDVEQLANKVEDLAEKIAVLQASE